MYDKFIHFLPCAISKRMIIIEQSLNMVFSTPLYKKQNIYAPLKTSVTLPRDPRELLSASNAGTNLVISSLRPPLRVTTSNKNWSMDGLIETYACWILETYALLNRAFLFQMFYTNMLAKNFFRYNFWFTYVLIIQLYNAQLCIFLQFWDTLYDRPGLL